MAALSDYCSGYPESASLEAGSTDAGVTPYSSLAGLKELVVLYHALVPVEAWSKLGFGLLVASISAFAAIWSLMHLLERFSSWP